MAQDKNIRNHGCKNVQSQQNSGKLDSVLTKVRINSDTSTNDSLKESSTKEKDGLTRAIDNPDRLEPTRYGDWEKNGRCIDF